MIVWWPTSCISYDTRRRQSANSMWKVAQAATCNMKNSFCWLASSRMWSLMKFLLHRYSPLSERNEKFPSLARHQTFIYDQNHLIKQTHDGILFWWWCKHTLGSHESNNNPAQGCLRTTEHRTNLTESIEMVNMQTFNQIVSSFRLIKRVHIPLLSHLDDLKHAL